MVIDSNDKYFRLLPIIKLIIIKITQIKNKFRWVLGFIKFPLSNEPQVVFYISILFLKFKKITTSGLTSYSKLSNLSQNAKLPLTLINI